MVWLFIVLATNSNTNPTVRGPARQASSSISSGGNITSRYHVMRVSLRSMATGEFPWVRQVEGHRSDSVIYGQTHIRVSMPLSVLYVRKDIAFQETQKLLKFLREKGVRYSQGEIL